MKALPLPFFNRNAVSVARDLIGCTLARKRAGKIERFTITETEAYEDHRDLASHASKGRTKRTEIMFRSAGHIYVYLVYGNHWMLNIVTGAADYPAAVLIRGLEGVNGPGRLTKRLGITGAMNGKLLSREIGLWIETPVRKIPPRAIKRMCRIGVDYAGPVWSKKKWRFVL